MLIVRMLHILSSFWFMSGLLGRWLSYAQATRAGDLQTTDTSLRLSDRFERLMVIPGSTVVLVLGLLTAWLQGQPVLGFLQGAPTNWLLASLVLFLSIIPIVVLVLVPRRKQRHAALARAVADDTFTPELRAVLSDRVVIGARMAELALTIVVLILMILKPF